MSAIDKLEEIWNTYQVTKDCLKVTERSINKKPHHLKILRSTDFITEKNIKIGLYTKAPINNNPIISHEVG